MGAAGLCRVWPTEGLRAACNYSKDKYQDDGRSQAPLSSGRRFRRPRTQGASWDIEIGQEETLLPGEGEQPRGVSREVGYLPPGGGRRTQMDKTTAALI